MLAPGEKPSILVEPWNTEVKEPIHIFNGTYKGDIRIWGRRRLFVLESLLLFLMARQKLDFHIFVFGRPKS